MLISSAIFGLWHVLPSLGFADANSGVSDQGASTAGVIAVTVLATGAFGAILAWLRLRSGSLVAPIIVHGVINGSALLATWLLG